MRTVKRNTIRRTPIQPESNFPPKADYIKIQKEILLSLYQDFRTHARHKETLRSQVTTILFAASAGLVTAITWDDKVNGSDIGPSALLIMLGVVSLLLSLAHSERYSMNRNYADTIMREIDNLYFNKVDSDRYETKTTLQELETSTHNKRKWYYKIIRKFSRSGYLWAIFPILTFILGVIFFITSYGEYKNSTPKPNEEQSVTINLKHYK